MTSLSVAQAAERLGVSVPRIHQRIADGSLAAERIGSQWAVDERSLLRIQERSKAGRPLSARSAWAVIAASEGDRGRLRASGSAAPARARMQLKRLLEPAGEPSVGEEAVRELGVSLRSMLRNRAERRLLRGLTSAGRPWSTLARVASPPATSRHMSLSRMSTTW
jgi:excisionase family DNA binding protein